MVEEIMEEDLRFGMKMRALRGDFTPANPVEDTEAGPSLAAAIMPFPGMVEMRVVVKRRGAGTALEPTPVPDIVHLLNCVPGVKVLTSLLKKKNSTPQHLNTALSAHLSLHVCPSLFSRLSLHVSPLHMFPFALVSLGTPLSLHMFLSTSLFSSTCV